MAGSRGLRFGGALSNYGYVGPVFPMSSTISYIPGPESTKKNCLYTQDEGYIPCIVLGTLEVQIPQIDTMM